ncbi:hypothetical protein NSP_36330 [Nodularia spumigena CCY9414]|jgi:hypothetical protein|nr:hypothetical protein NSP_36330 [Nodularia spumigena CCY9414]
MWGVTGDEEYGKNQGDEAIFFYSHAQSPIPHSPFPMIQ